MTTLPKRFFPVIHCVSPHTMQGTGHAVINAQTAFTNDADGIFLIGHNLPYQELLYIYEHVRKQFYARWIGINLLDVSAADEWPKLRFITKSHSDLDALWMDSLPSSLVFHGFKPELFGNVAFKYRDSYLRGQALADACKNAVMYVDTITTSGHETGSPPEVEKLRVMREVIGPDTPLAIASGVSVENVASLKPYADTFLAASSITERSGPENKEYLVPDKVRAMAAEIHR